MASHTGRLLRQGHSFWHGFLHFALLFNFLAVPALAVLLPHWTIVWFYCGVIALPLMNWLAFGLKPGIDRALLWPLVLLFAWAAVTLLWTPADRGIAAWLAIRTLTTVAGALLLLDFCRRVPPAAVARTTPWVLPGLILAILLLVAEQLSHLALTSLISGETYEGPRWADRLNRGALAVLLHAFAPAFLLWSGGRRPAAAALLAGSLVLVSFYRSETALAAGLLALPLLAVALARPPAGRRLFLALGIAALLLPLPGAMLLDRLALQEAAWLDITARARVQIWFFTAERILERPFLGWGLDSADLVPNRGVVPLLPYADRVMPIHPHNGALQLWLEIGLPGVALALFALHRVARGLAALPPAAAAFLIAVATATLVAQSLSFAIWQSRWLALAFIVLLQVRLVIRARTAA